MKIIAPEVTVLLSFTFSLFTFAQEAYFESEVQDLLGFDPPSGENKLAPEGGIKLGSVENSQVRFDYKTMGNWGSAYETIPAQFVMTSKAGQIKAEMEGFIKNSKGTSISPGFSIASFVSTAGNAELHDCGIKNESISLINSDSTPRFYSCFSIDTAICEKLGQAKMTFSSHSANNKTGTECDFSKSALGQAIRNLTLKGVSQTKEKLKVQAFTDRVKLQEGPLLIDVSPELYILTAMKKCKKLEELQKAANGFRSESDSKLKGH